MNDSTRLIPIDETVLRILQQNDANQDFNLEETLQKEGYGLKQILDSTKRLEHLGFIKGPDTLSDKLATLTKLGRGYGLTEQTNYKPENKTTVELNFHNSQISTGDNNQISYTQSKPQSEGISWVKKYSPIIVALIAAVATIIAALINSGIITI